VISRSKGIFLILSLFIFLVSCADSSNKNVSDTIVSESTVKEIKTVETIKSEPIIEKEEVQKPDVENKPIIIESSDFIEEVGDNFIVSSDVWKKAFVLHSPDGKRTYGIGFSGISEEVNLYAPIDGYISYTIEKDGGRGNIIISLAPWDPAGTMEELNRPDRDKSFHFTGYGIEPTVGGKVKKGDLIGIINPEKEVYTEYLKERAVLVFEPEAEWDKGIDRSENPIKYAKQIIDLVEADRNKDEVFIIKSDLWKKAFITHQKGKADNDGVGFWGLPAGTTIFAPIDGYVHFFGVED